MLSAQNDKELLFLPLGGSGEIGMNLNLYGYEGRWLMIDCGITFERKWRSTEVQMPDPRFIVERRDQLEGLVITHAHEDHLGAVAHLWPRLRCPIYATPFPAAVLRRKLAAVQLERQVQLHEIQPGGQLSLPPFDLEFINVTHSTVECSAIAIRCGLGAVLHTGDFKLDPSPQVGAVTDQPALQKLGDDGLLAVISDSTNATKAGITPSESTVVPELRSLLQGRKGRVAVGCFASNIARVHTLLELASSLERHPVILGRSMHRMIDAAQETGYLGYIEQEVPAEDAGYLPPDKVMLICTGTQGEPGAALSRIAADDHRSIILDEGDAAIFSSKMIPGNEEAIELLHQRLGRLGVEVVSEKDAAIHVSGHPSQDDLRTLYQWTRPQAVVPVHGEKRHMEAHAAIAQACGAESWAPRNGQVIRIAPGPVRAIDEVFVGRLRVTRSGLEPVD